MALRALQLNAHEQRADRSRAAGGGGPGVLSHEPVEDQLRLVLDLALDGENVAHKLVPGGVLVELSRQPLAEVARLLHRLAAAVHVRWQLGRTDPFAPGTSEMVTEFRRGEELIDQPGALVRRGALKEGRRLFGRGYSPVQIEVQAPEKLRIFSRRGGLQSMAFELAADVAVQGFCHRAGFMFLAGGQQRLLILFKQVGQGWQSRRNPFLQHRLVLFRKRRFSLRHLIFGHRLPQRALPRLARHHRRAALAALEHGWQRSQIELAFSLQPAVAAHAVFLEDRKHIAFEQWRLPRLLSRHPRQDRHDGEQSHSPFAPLRRSVQDVSHSAPWWFSS